ncbi:MAG: hypothetical protein E7310_04495 [Clostridiales bacterium]|nr:hypothetical protein [Clostridiales bacterium]
MKPYNEDYLDILEKIKQQNFQFDMDDFLEYVKFSINRIYNNIYHNKIEPLYEISSKQFISTMLSNKSTYRISRNIDNFQIQFAKIHDYIEKDNEEFIKVYLSIFFYDKIINNYDYNEDNGDSFWNDIWIVTLKKELPKTSSNNIFVCDNCGANMTLNDLILTCNYCNNKKMFSKYNAQWKIVDIVVQK